MHVMTRVHIHMQLRLDACVHSYANVTMRVRIHALTHHDAFVHIQTLTYKVKLLSIQLSKT